MQIEQLIIYINNSITWIASITPWIGVLVIVYRLGSPFQRSSKSSLSKMTLPENVCSYSENIDDKNVWPTVSIIVPARNEELNLRQLLPSLRKLEYPSFEILVVDDESQDKTVSIAEQNQIKVISAGPKPEGWVGKNWACQVGADAVDSEYILFTDADTIHHPNSLYFAIQHMKTNKVSVLSSPPFHLSPSIWERCLGLFQILPLFITAFRSTPRPNRLYAIGQYLLFRRSTYLKLNGHHSVYNSLAEDIDLARQLLHQKERYDVWSSYPLYSVRMYSRVTEFWKGWERMIRMGLRRSSLQGFFEIALLFSAFSTAPSAIFVMFYLIPIQKRWGQFPFWTAFLCPISLLLFLIATLNAMIKTICSSPVQWKNRAYNSKKKTSS